VVHALSVSFKEEMHLQFYPDHYYVWGYALCSLAIFVVVALGSYLLLRHFRSTATIMLVAGSMAIAIGYLLDDGSWLILSGGDGNVAGLIPHLYRIHDMILNTAKFLIYAGGAVLGISLWFLARYLAVLRSRYENLQS